MLRGDLVEPKHAFVVSAYRQCTYDKQNVYRDACSTISIQVGPKLLLLSRNGSEDVTKLQGKVNAGIKSKLCSNF